MDTTYPRMLYRYPGPHQLQDGGYDLLTANNKDDEKAALAAGWSFTSPEARQAYAQSLVVASAAADEAAPTRAELEQKATELGIKFDGRTSDKTLATKIAAGG